MNVSTPERTLISMKTSRLGMRVRPEDKMAWEEAAHEAGLSLSAWIEYQLNVATSKKRFSFLTRHR